MGDRGAGRRPPRRTGTCAGSPPARPTPAGRRTTPRCPGGPAAMSGFWCSSMTSMFSQCTMATPPGTSFTPLEHREDLVVAHALDPARRDLATLVGHERLEGAHAELRGHPRDLVDLRLADDDGVKEHVDHALLRHRAPHLSQRVQIGAPRDHEGHQRGHAAGDGVPALRRAVRGERLGGVAEVEVRVEQPGEDEAAARVDGATGADGLSGAEHGRDRPVADGEPAVDDAVGLDDAAVPDEQVGVHRLSACPGARRRRRPAGGT